MIKEFNKISLHKV